VVEAVDFAALLVRSWAGFDTLRPNPLLHIFTLIKQRRMLQYCFFHLGKTNLLYEDLYREINRKINSKVNSKQF
jgi:hypothetical protein